MTWTCSRCGECHETEFESCWRCGISRPLTDAEVAEVELLEAEDKTPEAADVDQVDEALVDAYGREQGWYPGVPEDKAARAGNALHRLVVAYRLYRARQDESGQAARPDLDRRWTHFFLTSACLGGFVMTLILADAWLGWLAEEEVRFVLCYFPLLFGTIITGQRAVEAELRAAAESATRRGYRPRAT